MNEAEFRRQLDALGRKYQNNIGRMNNETSPGLKKKHQDVARAVLDEITALEKSREVAKAYDYIKARDRFMAQSHAPMVIVEPEFESIETWGGESCRVQTGVEAPIPLTWIDYHDQLAKEWFDGERKLVDDLYPATEKPARTASHVRDSLVSLVIALPLTGVLVLIVWLTKMFFGF